MPDRYVCLHGHFYQPPRENPWLEAVEMQDSAFPYHDWNERIAAECYVPNAQARILDGENRIQEIVNNYASISFNMGPTLMAWLEFRIPKIHEAIVEADRESRRRFDGHGSAMAQAYNHMIMPLANRRDKQTQVRWGLADFRHRFGGDPEAMWLPETAVDLETLDIMAAEGMRICILAPSQAERFRPIVRRKQKKKPGEEKPPAGDEESNDWRDAGDEKIDPTQPYLVRLPSGASIVAFFYDGPISRATAFEGLLDRGENLHERLMGAFSGERNRPQLVHTAIDGETFGHHHHRGEMALAYALRLIEQDPSVELTNYGQYLERHPPRWEARIHENSSWSCIHGIERWRAGCGCNSGMHKDWNQAWRAPLREALDWLRDRLAPLFEQAMDPLLKDPWAARDDYIHVILDRSAETAEEFFGRQGRRRLEEEEKILVLKAMELQRHAMLMFTSCGWFFDEPSGTETVQVIMYAARALQLAGELAGEELEEPFLEKLQRAPSNIPEHGNGRVIYDKFVRPAIVDLAKVGAHYAVSSVFHDYPETATVFYFHVERIDEETQTSGVSRLVVGRHRIRSEITWESAELSYAVLWLGDHNLYGGVRPYQDEKTYRELTDEAAKVFSRADLPELIRFLDRHFKASIYSLRSLFHDEQRAILARIMESPLSEIRRDFRRLYEQNAPLLDFLASLNIPVPNEFRAVAELTLTGYLLENLRGRDGGELNVERIRELLNQARSTEIKLDTTSIEFAYRRKLEEMARPLADGGGTIEDLERLGAALGLLETVPFEVNLAEVQNIYWLVLKGIYPERCGKARQGDEPTRRWLDLFLGLAEPLCIKVEPPPEDCR